MRILLDHMLPHELRRRIEGDVFTARFMGWAKLQNGDLLEAADEAYFDVLVTHDKEMRHQQNLTRYRLAVIQLDALSNRIDHLAPLVPSVNAALKTISPGELVVVG